MVVYCIQYLYSDEFTLYTIHYKVMGVYVYNALFSAVCIRCIIHCTVIGFYCVHCSIHRWVYTVHRVQFSDGCRAHAATLQSLNKMIQAKPLHCTVMHCLVSQCIVLHCTALYFTSLYYTSLHCIKLHYTSLFSTVLHCTTLPYTALCF